VKNYQKLIMFGFISKPSQLANGLFAWLTTLHVGSTMQWASRASAIGLLYKIFPI
jgi:hypothetical protein